MLEDNIVFFLEIFQIKATLQIPLFSHFFFKSSLIIPV